MGWKSSAHLPLSMTCFEGLTLAFNGKNQKQWGEVCNVGWPSHSHVHAHEPTENTETFMNHENNKVIQSFTQHLFGDLWIQYFWNIIFNLVFDLVLNPLLLFHRVVHIPSYSCTFKLGYLNMNVNIVHVGIDLWMMGFWQMLHSSQNTQASIESYHGALKHWLSLEKKRFQGWWID